MSMTSTHSSSKFTSFELTLSNGAIASGIHYFPPVWKTAGPLRPLVVLLHGAGFTAHQFDISATNTASVAAELLSVPVVSINRPGYKSSTSFYPIPEDSTYHQEVGKWLYLYALPAVWEQFGIPNSCGSIVLLAHSCAAPGVILCAGRHAQENNLRFPLAGLVIYGWGCQQAEGVTNAPPDRTEEGITKWRNRNMFSEPELKAVDPDLLEYLTPQYHPIESEEVLEIVAGPWNSYWHKYADQIKVPIMFANGEIDRLWAGTVKHLKQYETMFPKCPRFDGSVVNGAPHAIECSRFAQGWYARCFGFALEVTACSAIQEEIKVFNR